MSKTKSIPQANRLVEHVGKAFIIAYKESTQLLENALRQEGFDCEVLRQEDKPEFQQFSRSYLCLMNHCRAWERATQAEQKLTLIVEADFVPVVGLGHLPVPFHPQQSNAGIAWLYTCAPQVYSVSKEGYAEGYSTSMVAYLVTPQSARYLEELAADFSTKLSGTTYSTWDSEVDTFLRAKNLKNYIPFRNYGEHGGRPNPEHRQNGFSGIHQADVLCGNLAFQPLYATDETGSRLKNFLSARLQARFKGLARLATGRFLRLPVVRNSSTPARLISFAIRRQLSLRL
ncbi:LPS biosynthesis glycosyltransferase [Leptolyngbya sp. FACHB-261]|nr:LPS biosynthesis glycosyltransferase [Leptolyngbya sp. FACHB-261]